MSHSNGDDERLVNNSDFDQYKHLMTTEFLPSLKQTIYRCKEHYDNWYIDQAGIVMGHFRPFHN
jgi:hypothetical protein